MKWLLECWRSSIGGKVTMAITGLLLFGFVVGHLLGNLQLLGDPQAIDDYAAFLKGKPMLLWSARVGLLAAFVLHVVTGVRLARQNRQARPVAYSKQATIDASWASRSMMLTGLSTLVFVVYHLLHFTIGSVHVDTADLEAGHVYAMVTASFAEPTIAIAYAAFNLVLLVHLGHGIQSLAQTLGIHHERYTPMIRTLSWMLAVAVAGGNVLLALSVMTGLVEVAA